ncbi:hypothetical protein A2755_00805 [Candidatus Wolfebacteria bacterium RIFCSPHIGHO2_01_FULL_48_22]|uniref:Uncharacterized protein n=2 Tax=Candidatus Wolfeibacteriota TaxID=1752735 RepID=A0A1F8DTE7_9BACT|nr:MAG: hypothetical protein A2755_00805 [Candidatus Wolfebacteria bacterium RIFCSPHIGHO2_01_FULL_48_22]OGM93555.1 MAG: hypothetical protein A2935_02920 [Candidatus Wolfebacteria bacterium RIFCSPLOWO2_01_FULL_47_17b]
MGEQYIKKNLKLSTEFDSYMVRSPRAYKKIPRGAYVVITVKGDKKFNESNIALAEHSKRPNRKFVEAHKQGSRWILRPLVFQQ